MSDQRPLRDLRWDAFNDEVKEEFLIKIVECGGHLQDAAKACGYAPATVYKHMRKDKEFAAAVHEARQTAIPMVEDELIRRVLYGIPEPVFYQGAQVVDPKGDPVFLMKKTDQSLKMLLSALLPEKYKDRFEHSGPNGSPLNSNVHIYLPDNKRGPKPAEPETESGEETPTKTS